MSLNKPATAVRAEVEGVDKPAPGNVQRWSTTPQWYLWEGGYFLIGRAEAVIPPHSHHAIQLVIAIDGEVGIRGKRGDFTFGRGLVVRPDVEHSYNANGALVAMLFVDPESVEGAWLRTSVRADISMVPDARLASPTAELRRFLEDPLAAMNARELIKHCVHALCSGAPPSRRLDPRITKVLGAIRAADDLRMSVEDAAATVFLSPSRFAHLFKQQVGLPFRRYMLWRKLTRAMLVIGREKTMATAAHAADFADAAHLTRTFYQMFGIAPSVFMRGEFFEIPSPFELTESLPADR
jgi:AraC family transcriptional regulator